MYVTTEGGQHSGSGRFAANLESDRSLVLIDVIGEILAKLGLRSAESDSRATAVRSELNKRDLSANRMEELRLSVRRQALTEVEGIRLRLDADRSRATGKR